MGCLLINSCCLTTLLLPLLMVTIAEPTRESTLVVVDVVGLVTIVGNIEVGSVDFMVKGRDLLCCCCCCCLLVIRGNLVAFDVDSF